jgi:hypothetical protein
MEALSVYHAHPLDGYRQARDIPTESATTEDLRGAMINYRALFEGLLGARVGNGQVQRARGLRGDTAVGNERIATETTGNSETAAENSDRTADTPR